MKCCELAPKRQVWVINALVFKYSYLGRLILYQTLIYNVYAVAR